MRRLLRAQLLVAALFALALPAAADADVFGSLSLLSASPLEQADYAHDPAISGDGDFVVFDGSVGGVTGVWRRETRPGGSLEEVAGGDAELPSISDDGRYVSFTTNEGGVLPAITNGQADPEHQTGESPDVYVRDMSVAPSEAGAFTIASAANGSNQGLSYEYASGGGEQEAFEKDHYGSLAAGRSALSADGRKVVFVTTAVSDLDGPGTPPLQVAVRDLDTQSTELVSVKANATTGAPETGESGGPLPVAVAHEGGTLGAVYTGGQIPAFNPPSPYKLTAEIPASISGDGTTAAWLAQSLGEQVVMLPGEAVRPKYSEPLWRRIGDGEQAPTRRVTGGSDPSAPGCAASGEQVLPEEASLNDPCQGPFASRPQSALGVWTGGEGDIVPRLSGDGYSVAFLANATLVALGNDFNADTEGRPGDVYVVNMHEGLTRDQAIEPLTEVASGGHEVTTTAPIVDFGVSPDGTQVSFTTRRTVFPLGAPAYVSVPAAVPGMLELFDVDLADQTLTRVSHGYEGGASAHPHEAGTASAEDEYVNAGDGALSPSFSDSGNQLAFSSTASNLVFGDGNTPPLRSPGLDGSDAFVVPRIVFAPQTTPQVVSSPPPAPAITAPWLLGATARSLGNGTVRVYVRVPGSGSLRAQASGTVVARAARSAHGRPKVRVVTRIVSATTIDANPAATTTPATLVLKLAPAYQSLAARRRGFSATASITFTAPGHPALHERLAVTFVRRTTKRKAKR